MSHQGPRDPSYSLHPLPSSVLKQSSETIAGAPSFTALQGHRAGLQKGKKWGRATSVTFYESAREDPLP